MDPGLPCGVCQYCVHQGSLLRHFPFIDEAIWISTCLSKMIRKSISDRSDYSLQVTSAKVMLEHTGFLPVSSLQLFSSVSATVGNPGQTNYAAANGNLDALAGGLQDSGVAAHSVAWGAWGGGGMAASLLTKLMRQGDSYLALMSYSWTISPCNY